MSDVRYSIDRIEGKIAVCVSDDGTRLELNLSEMYENPKEGDIFLKCGDGCVFDEEATANKRKRIIALQNSLFE